jgi:tRNA pseudouridine55 synthase
MLEKICEGSVLYFDKPLQWTSFDVVKKIRSLTKAKIGHAGTLDPLASGLLILCTGKETKNIDSYQAKEKEYTGSFTIGATTLSFDLETSVDKTFDWKEISEIEIYEASKLFIGKMDQVPPIYSALYQDGKRLYKLARKGKTIEIKKRPVEIFEFEITKIEMPQVYFRIVCGKGFYVRSLADDFGKALNNGAHLSSLRRTRIGPFQVGDAYQIDDFEKIILEEKKSIHARSPEA